MRTPATQPAAVFRRPDGSLVVFSETGATLAEIPADTAPKRDEYRPVSFCAAMAVAICGLVLWAAVFFGHAVYVWVHH